MPSHPEEGIWCRQQGEQGVEGKMILGEGQGQRGEREYGSEAGRGEKLLVGRAGTGKGTGTGKGKREREREPAGRLSGCPETRSASRGTLLHECPKHNTGPVCQRIGILGLQGICNIPSCSLLVHISYHFNILQDLSPEEQRTGHRIWPCRSGREETSESGCGR